MSACGTVVLASVDTRKSLEKNKIDLDVLADLTDGDLQEPGVPLGDRRRRTAPETTQLLTPFIGREKDSKRC